MTTDTIVECPRCDGTGYEDVHAGVVECDDCDGTGTRKDDIMELTERQRHRVEDIKNELKIADPDLPRPSDEQVMNGLLDTWDAVGEGHYSKEVPNAE